MKVKIHAKNFDKKMSVALHTLVEFVMSDLLSDRKGLLKNLEIDVHMKHHSHEGEAEIHEKANKYAPRKFRVYVDHHRLEKDDYGRVKGETEWAHDVFRTLCHELVHVRDYVLGRLTFRRWSWRDTVSFEDNGLFWDGVHYDVNNLKEYFELPYEIEAYGREKGLLVSFLAFWTEVENKLGDELDSLE
jgi:hypothetical protein